MKLATMILALVAGLLAHGMEPSSWIFLPGEDNDSDDPQRLVFSESGGVTWQMLFAGVRSQREGRFSDRDSRIECHFDEGQSIVLEVHRESLELIDEEHENRLRFVKNPEWDKRFNEAPPIPKTKAEAIETLLKLFPEEGRKEFASSKKEDLIQYHFGFGMMIRNAFGLWNPNSPLLEDLGGGHPDSASMVLIEAFWEELQARGEAEQPASDNADNRASEL